MVNPVLNKLFPHFLFFFDFLKYRIYVTLILSLIIGVLDGFGLSMLLPLVGYAGASSELPFNGMGSFNFLIEYVESLGFVMTLQNILLIMLFFVVLKGILSYLNAYLNVVYLQYFTKSIRIGSIDALSVYNFKAFIEIDSGAIQNSLSGEASRVVAAYNEYSKILQVFILVVTYTFLAYLSSPEFSIIVILGGIFTNFLFSQLYRKTKYLSMELVKSNNVYQGLLIQKIAYFKYLMATAMISKYAAYLKREVYSIETSVRKMGAIGAIFTGLREPLLLGIVVLVILIQVNFSGTALSSILLSLLFFYRGLNGVIQLQGHYNSFLNYSGSLDNFKKIMGNLHYHSSSYGDKSFKSFHSNLSLQDISFAYRGKINVLNRISLTIKKNETIALVGESGSGKTTLMNILSGLLLPTEGQFLIDGTPVQNLDIRTFQARIGYITQDPVVFDDTVFNNVTFWEKKSPAILEKFKVAMEKAAIFDFFDQLPGKENTRLGHKGIQLSGGQIQRVCIARELYKDVDFLLMDEATSALDSKTERIIQENIERLKGKITIIIIAHRLSTIKHADRVVVLNQGQMEHIGTFDHLMQNSDSFKTFVELQEL